GHQLEHGRAPWRDPYSFRPEARPTINFAAWPFGVPFWPLDAALGHVRAWNAFVLLTYLAAGGLACLWLRELGLPRGAALAGGLAFAIAPYRVEQSTGHLLGPISILLPLALWAVERRWLWPAAPVSLPAGARAAAAGRVPVRRRARRLLSRPVTPRVGRGAGRRDPARRPARPRLRRLGGGRAQRRLRRLAHRAARPRARAPGL